MEDKANGQGKVHANHDRNGGVIGRTILHLGLDDIDRPEGGCTTHLASFFVEEILRQGGRFIDYPNLIRLNPDIPWKTRGNGAVALRFTFSGDVDALLERLIEMMKRYVTVSEDTNPGMVIYRGESPSRELRELAKRALHDVVPPELVESIINSREDLVSYHLGNGRGRIGALAAIGNDLSEGDYTFELLTYRGEENLGKDRAVDEESVWGVDKDPATFANIDYESGRVLITPRGRDPVLFGIRGETPQAVYSAFLKLRVSERVDRWMIFVTNQGTDAHFETSPRGPPRSPFVQTVFEGVVESPPNVIRGGHVILKISPIRGGGTVKCLVYSESGRMANFASSLVQGDLVRIYGGAKPKRGEIVVNVQKIEVIGERRSFPERPVCAGCGGRMESLGRGKGFFCNRCKLHIPYVELSVEKHRLVAPKVVLPPYRSIRHLTKPIKRYGREKKGRKLGISFSPWCSFLADSGCEDRRGMEKLI